MRRGVRYSRCLPPPREEWEPDFAAMADAGFGFVVLPAPWAFCHASDEGFDFAPLAEQLDMAGRRGLDAVVAVDLTAAPAWLTAKHPEHLHESAAGAKALPHATPDAPAGGWPGLCFDNGAVRSHAGRFLRALAEALAGHPRVTACDLTDCWALDRLFEWEPGDLYCQCPGSRARFIAWLRRTYAEDLDALARAWARRLSRWADVSPPAKQGRSPDVLDWVRFHRHALAAQLRWCVEALREADPSRSAVVAGTPFGREAQADGPALAAEATEWGCRPGHPDPSPYEHAGLWPHEAMDRLRGVAPAGKLWLVDLPVRDQAVVQRVQWSLLRAGADAVVYAAWRPDCHEAERLRPGLVRPDGGPSPRLEAVRAFDRLAAAHPDLASARPGPPEVAVVLVPETQVFWAAGFYWALAGPGVYRDSLEAACRAFEGRGARTVLMRPGDLTDQPLAYVPMGLAVGEATAGALRAYVERGGCLVAEACLGLFDEHGRQGRVSPGCGLAERFGARAIDAAESVRGSQPPSLKGRRASYPCAFRREPLEATTGKVKATFADGSGAIVDHAVGKGTTRLVGTCPSFGASHTEDPRHARVILDSLPLARLRPRVTVSAPGNHVALLHGREARYIVAFNPTAGTQQATVRISRAVGTFRTAVNLHSGKALRLRLNARRLKLPPAEGLVLRLEPASARPHWS